MNTKNRLKTIPLYVLLFPAFSVLVLAANNLGQIELKVILRPLLYSTLASLIVFFVCWLFFQKYYPAGILTFLISFFSLTYGHFFTLMEDRVIGNWVIGTHTYMLILWAVLFLAAVYFLLFKINDLSSLTMILKIVMGALVLFQIGIISAYEVKAQIISDNLGTDQDNTLLQPPDTSTMPDIYFIILDKYARSDALQSFYKYDNSEFIAGLESQGFWVAPCSRSNYAFTVMSLSSQLNMAYVEDLTDNPSLKTTTALIKNNIVHEAVEEAGYTTIAFEMGFTWGNMKNFDFYFDEIPDNIDTWSLDPFEILYLRSTLGVLLFEGTNEVGEQVSMTDIERKAARTQLILDVLPEIPQKPGPKFVHAHIVTPHPPYIFNADGTLNPNPEERNPSEGYRAQLAFIEKRILAVVQQIIENSETQPIIIIEGDHGFGKKYVTSNLLAMHLPDNGEAGLPDDMTLVNVFPHIFNTYFGTEIDYLPNLSFTHTDDWYESVLIEEWNPACKATIE